MDPSDRRYTQGANDAGGDAAMESGDWRAQLQRKRTVNKIMEILLRHIPFSRHERVQELKKIAQRVEEEIYSSARSQSEYSRKICFMMLTMEASSQMRSNSGALYHRVNSNTAVPLDSTSQTGNQNVGNWQEEVYQKIKAMKELYLLDLTAQVRNLNREDWQEEVYQKIKSMKDLYLPDLNDMHQKLVSKMQQYDSLPQQPKKVQFEKLKVFKNMLERFMQLLQIPKHAIPAYYKDKVGIYEKQIISVINSNRRKPAPPQ